MTFELQIVTPDGLIFEGEAEKLFCRTIAGDVCILARHCNYMTALGMGEARVTMADGTVRRAACIGGMLAVTGGKARLGKERERAEQIVRNSRQKKRGR